MFDSGPASCDKTQQIRVYPAGPDLKCQNFGVRISAARRAAGECAQAGADRVGTADPLYKCLEFKRQDGSVWPKMSARGLSRNGGTPFEGRQTINRVAGFLLRQAQFVQALQIEPKFRARAEKMRQSQGCVSRDGTLAVQDAGNAVGRDAKLPGQFGGAHAEGVEFFP
jgi:hypothetical protein